MKRFLFAMMVLGVSTMPAGASSLKPNKQLHDECHTSLQGLEQMFMAYDDRSDFDPTVHLHIARMNMLINMVSFCSESGLLPMTRAVFNELKNELM